MKIIISKYGMHIFALFILIMAIIECGQKTIFATKNCPCRMTDKAETVYGKVVYFIDSDSVQFNFKSDEYYEKEIGYIYE